METQDIFMYKEYRSYLNDILLKRAKIEKGQKLKLANSIRCNPAYLTRILDGRTDLSLEQSQSVNEFLSHTNIESRFFLNLVLMERSATRALKAYFLEELNKIKKERLILKNRIQPNRELSETDQARYYSSWHFAAIHMAVSIGNLRSKEQLAQALKLPAESINEAIEFLLNIGVLKQSENKYSIGETHIFLSKGSPFITKHHTNWRIKAIQALDYKLEENFHYSGVITCSINDLPTIKEVLIRAVKEIREIVKDSPEESLCAYTLDLFKLV